MHRLPQNDTAAPSPRRHRHRPFIRRTICYRTTSSIRNQAWLLDDSTLVHTSSSLHLSRAALCCLCPRLCVCVSVAASSCTAGLSSRRRPRRRVGLARSVDYRQQNGGRNSVGAIDATVIDLISDSDLARRKKTASVRPSTRPSVGRTCGPNPIRHIETARRGYGRHHAHHRVRSE